MGEREISVAAQAEQRLPRGLAIRPGTEEDEFATFDVMRRSMGYDMNWSHHAATRAHLRVSSRNGYWVAEETPRFGNSRIVGYARSLVREGIWMLTEFFVVPGHHRKGIGRALLLRCLEDGTNAGAHTRLVLASQHPSADSLYIREASCFPRLPMLLLAGSMAALNPPVSSPVSIVDPSLPAANVPEDGQSLLAEPMQITPVVQTAIDALDRQIVGYARPEEHAHWATLMGGMKHASRLFRGPADATGHRPIVGYAYIGHACSGPALAASPELLPSMLAHVSALQRQQPAPFSEFSVPSEVDMYWAVAGTNEVVLRWLLDCGWQIVFQYLFMSSRPLGQLDRYVCHNPLYFL